MFAPLLTACLLLAPPGADPPQAPQGLPEGVRAYDSFEAVRPGQYLLGSQGGDGWAGPWAPEPLYLGSPPPSRHPRRADHLLGMADSLQFDGVVSAGGSVSSVALNPHLGAISRPLAHPVGLPGTTTYIGVLVKPEGQLHAGSLDGCFGLLLYWGDVTGRDMRDPRHRPRTHDIAVGKPWTDSAENPTPDSRTREWCLFQIEGPVKTLRAAGRPINRPVGHLPVALGGGDAYIRHQLSTGAAPLPGETTLLVLRVEASRDGMQAVTSALVNPDPTQPEPPPGAAFLAPRSFPVPNQGPYAGPYVPIWITLFSSGAVTFDEVRVADTLAGAAGIQKPLGDG